MAYISNLTVPAGYPPVPANSTPVWTGSLVDSTGTPVGSGALTTLTLTLLDTITNSVVNGVSAVNILNTGRGTVDALGNILIAFEIGDMQLVGCGDNPVINKTAEHDIIIDFTYNGGLKSWQHICRITVQDGV